MDSWFNGYTKHYSVSVWVGYDHQYEAGNYLDNNSVALASLFYKNIMTYMSQGKTNTDWRKPKQRLCSLYQWCPSTLLGWFCCAPSSELFGSSTSSRSSSSETSSSSSGSSSSSESSASSESSSESSSNSSSSASQSSSQPSRPTDDNSSSANSTPPAEPDSQAENQTTNSGNPPQ